MHLGGSHDIRISIINVRVRVVAEHMLSRQERKRKKERKKERKRERERERERQRKKKKEQDW